MNNKEQSRDIQLSRENEPNESVGKILEILRGGSWRLILSGESIGGNAGPNRACLNAIVRQDSGEILELGNTVILPDGTAQVGFIYYIGRFKIVGKEIKVTENGKFLGVINKFGASEQAMQNLNRALEIYKQETEASL